MKTICTTIAFFLRLYAFKLEKATISGYLRDAVNFEALNDTPVSKQGTSLGTTANEYCFYSLTLPKGKRSILLFSFHMILFGIINPHLMSIIPNVFGH